MPHSAVAMLGDASPALIGRLAPRYSLVMIPLLSFCAGVLQMAYAEGSPLDYLLSFLLATSVAMWMIDDSARRGRPLTHSVQLLSLATWPAAALVYLLRTRGLVGLGWWLLNAAGMIAASTAGSFACYRLLWG